MDVACTKEACPRERPCCNICTGSPALVDPQGGQRVVLRAEDLPCRGNDCAMECKGLTAGEVYVATGRFDLGGPVSTLALRELRRADGTVVAVGALKPSRAQQDPLGDVLWAHGVLLLLSVVALAAVARGRHLRGHRLIVWALALVALTLLTLCMVALAGSPPPPPGQLITEEHPLPLRLVIAPAVVGFALLLYWLLRARRERRWWEPLACALAGTAVVVGAVWLAVWWFRMPGFGPTEQAQRGWLWLIGLSVSAGSFTAVAGAALRLDRSNLPVRKPPPDEQDP